MAENDHYELEERLKKFLSGALTEMGNKLMVDFKNLLLEHEKQITKEMSTQDKEILLIKRDIQEIKHDMQVEQIKLNDFKKEMREKVSQLNDNENKVKGAGVLVRWVIGGGILGWIGLAITIAMKVFGG